MNATDVLDAYLDQYCNRSSRHRHCTKPPRHGVRPKGSSSAKKPLPASELLPIAAPPLSPGRTPAQRHKAADVEVLNTTALVGVSRKDQVPQAAVSIAKQCALLQLAGNLSQQQISRQPSESPQPHKEAPGPRRHKAKVVLGNGLPALYGEIRFEACFSCQPLTLHCTHWQICTVNQAGGFLTYMQISDLSLTAELRACLHAVLSHLCVHSAHVPRNTCQLSQNSPDSVCLSSHCMQLASSTARLTGFTSLQRTHSTVLSIACDCWCR